MNQEKLIVVFGEYKSLKETFYQALRDTSFQTNLVEKIKPSKLKDGELISIMSTPDFQSTEQLGNLFSYIHEFARLQGYQICQVVFCLKDRNEITSYIQEIYGKFVKFFYSYNKEYKPFTFIIDENLQKQNSCLDLQKQITIGRVLQLNKNTIHKHIETWFSNHKQEFLTSGISKSKNYFYNDFGNTIIDLFNTWKKEIQQAEFSDICQLLYSFENLTNQKRICYAITQLTRDMNHSSAIQKFLNLLYFSNELQVYFDLKESDLSNKYFSYEFFNNCKISSQNHFLNCLNYQWQFSFPQKFRFQGTPFSFGQENNTLTYILQNSDFKKFLIKIITGICISFYYDCLNLIEQQFVQKEVNQNLNPNEMVEQQIINSTFEEETIESNQTQEYINALLLSCENDDKTKIFVHLSKNFNNNEFLNQGEFKKSHAFKERFCLIDSPYFSFEDDQEEKMQTFSDYFKENHIHYIFMFVDYQRTDQMKDRINSMMKELLDVDRSRIAIVVTKYQNTDQNNDEQKIRQFAKIKQIESVIFLKQDETADSILELFSQSMKNVDLSCISFQGTEFATKTAENIEEEEKFHEKLKVFSKEIEAKEKKQLIASINDLEDSIKKTEDILWAQRSQLYEKRQLLYKMQNEERKETNQYREKTKKKKHK